MLVFFQHSLPQKQDTQKDDNLGSINKIVGRKVKHCLPFMISLKTVIILRKQHLFYLCLTVKGKTL